MKEIGSYPILGWFEPNIRDNMVYVAQLVECLIVVQEAVGSTPIIHTNSSQRTRLRHMKQGGGMRVVDQNYLNLRSLMEKPQNTNLMIGSSTLSEGTTK